ncbi:hypothetical protein EEB18_016685 [Sphingopyxis sp. OPL5]|uniref:hypothetical protein n=1 Tax=Sphingopyxis sp. OPL5 TaxID=2486273 RepID=UPI0016572DFF|nr:hypothetical protein [Sphingopyxis sp. OPL5]QNO26380.1 hypothetical protein EEB18_016685 [Sphingopyxis sp. OPL5]
MAVAQELRRLSASARPLLKNRDDQRLTMAAQELETWFQSNRPGPFSWTIDPVVETEESTSYQGQGGAHAVSARFTFLWICERTDDPTLVGAARGGTNVVIRRNGSDAGKYHFDLCAGGNEPQSEVMHCFSHAQVDGRTSFPRFPSVLLLPSDVLEMLLFELWPSGWQGVVDKNRNGLLGHHRAQRIRLTRVARAFQHLATKRYPLVSLHAPLSESIRLF